MAYRKDLERSALMMSKIKNPLQQPNKNGKSEDPPKMKDYVLTGITVDAPIDVTIGRSTKRKSNFGPTTVTPDSKNPGIIREQSPESVVINWEKGHQRRHEEKRDRAREYDGPATIQSTLNRNFRDKLKQKAKKILNK